MAPGAVWETTATAGCRGLVRVGRLIGPANGYGCRALDGPGLRTSRGAGLLIITEDGHFSRASAGHGCRAFIPTTTATIALTISGDRRWSISSIRKLRAATMSRGTR